jgi:hypothetical protein
MLDTLRFGWGTLDGSQEGAVQAEGLRLEYEALQLGHTTGSPEEQ